MDPLFFILSILSDDGAFVKQISVPALTEKQYSLIMEANLQTAGD